MKKSELTMLRNLVKEEIERRKIFNEYLLNKDVIEFIKYTGGSTKNKDLNDIRGIIAHILKDFKVSKTNGIYVCTEAYDEDTCTPFKYYLKPNSKPEHMIFVDIESRENIERGSYYCINVKQSDFVKNHIVLNPYNRAYNDKHIRENGYEDVRLDFFFESYRNGQNSAIVKILKKYPRL